MNFRVKYVHLFLFVAPIIIWFYNPFQLYFLSDDTIHIPKNWHFRFQMGPYYRPMSDLTLFLDLNLYGTKAWGFHLTNLLLHFSCTLLLYFFSKNCLLNFKVKNAKQIAGLASFLFLIYAFHSEAVLWIIGRGGSLSVFFAGFSLVFFLKRSENKVYYWLSLFFFICGLFAYESAWIVPLVLSLFVAFSVPRKNYRGQIKYVSGFWLAFMIFLFIRRITEGSVIGTTYAGSGFIESGLTRYLYNYAALFFRSFVPPAPTVLFVVVSIVVLLILGTILFFLFQRKLFFSFRWFIWISFLVSLSVYVMSGIDTHDTEGERFLYMPSFFLSIILADLFLLIPAKKIRAAALIFWTVIHLFFLSRSAQAFKYSSQVAKSTIGELQDHRGPYNNIYLANLPTQYRGAFIFRIDFENYMKWLVPGMHYNKVTLISKKEIYSKGPQFRTILGQWNNPQVKVFLEKNPGVQARHRNDALLYWTDSTFLFIE